MLQAYLILLFGDIPAVSKLLMMKGHNGYYPCHYCKIRGVQIPGEKVNYFPLHCEDDTHSLHSLWCQGHHWFIKQANRIIAAEMVAKYDWLSHKHGIKGLPRLFLGSVRFPASFPFDFMHLIFKNLVPNLIRHYTRDFKGLNAGTETYELLKNMWEAIMDAGAQSRDTIPSEFGAQMPNICTERSNMTAKTWSTWIMHLRPIIMQGQFLKPVYYKHFLKLLCLVCLCMLYEMKQSDIELIRNGFIKWVQEYER